MSSWIEYWNSDTPIYVNERHKMLHYRLVAKDITALIDGEGWNILDHGCGEATSADLVAAKCAKLYLCDAAPNTRAKIVSNAVNVPEIRVISPEDVGLLEPFGMDLIVSNSLLQYLDNETLDGLLETWKGKLKPTGKLILGDVIPPDVSPVTDALALLKFGFEGGFLIAAIFGLVRTFFSDYRKLRGELGIRTHTEADILNRLDNHGFSAKRLEKNLGHNPSRMTFEARVAQA